MPPVAVFPLGGIGPKFEEFVEEVKVHGIEAG
jgi:hypothetical protein